MRIKHRSWMLKILKVLRKHFGKINWEFEDPFKLLIATILSQHTSDKNSLKAFESLEEKIGVEPEKLANRNTSEIAKAIKSAGLWKIKAKRIKEVSKIVLKDFSGDLSEVLSQPLEEARKTLLKLPGVGEKTADVLLVFSGGMPVFPVDTHLFTVARRLGISTSKNYESVKKAYEKLIPPTMRGEAHILLLTLGKEYCIARKPKCWQCPIKKLCPYPEKTMV
jgi:endonuclease-3